MKQKQEKIQTEHFDLVVVTEELEPVEVRSLSFGDVRMPEQFLTIQVRNGVSMPVRVSRAEAEVLRFLLHRYASWSAPMYTIPPPPAPWPPHGPVQ